MPVSSCLFHLLCVRDRCVAIGLDCVCVCVYACCQELVRLFDSIEGSPKRGKSPAPTHTQASPGRQVLHSHVAPLHLLLSPFPCPPLLFVVCTCSPVFLLCICLFGLLCRLVADSSLSTPFSSPPWTSLPSFSHRSLRLLSPSPYPRRIITRAAVDPDPK